MDQDQDAHARRIVANLDTEDLQWLKDRLRGIVDEMAEVLADMERESGQRRPWGTPELRREVIARYHAYLQDRGAKKLAIDSVGFGWRTIENWPEWGE